MNQSYWSYVQVTWLSFGGPALYTEGDFPANQVWLIHWSQRYHEDIPGAAVHFIYSCGPKNNFGHGGYDSQS